MAGTDAGHRIGLGARLRTARERTGFTLIQAAEKLHLEPSVIEALEAENFEVLSAPVYVRGHLRRYAMLVGESPGELLLMYDSVAAVTETPDLTRVPHAERVMRPPQLARPLVGVIVALTVVAGVWLVLRGLPPVAPREPTQAEPAAGAGQPAAAQPSRSTQPSAGMQPAGVQPRPLAQPGAAVQSDIATQPDAARAPLAAQNTGESVQLRLQLAAESWVEIYDAANQRLYYDLGSAGRTISVSGAAPLRVVLGKAAAVGVESNGVERSIPAETRRGESARFLVDRSGRLTRVR